MGLNADVCVENSKCNYSETMMQRMTQFLEKLTYFVLILITFFEILTSLIFHFVVRVIFIHK